VIPRRRPAPPPHPRRLGGLDETIGETAEQYPRDDADRRSCAVYERNPPLDVLLQDAPLEIEHPDVDGWRNEQEQPPASDDETGGHTEKSHREQVDDAWSLGRERNGSRSRKRHAEAGEHHNGRRDARPSFSQSGPLHVRGPPAR
jgi:hypothetical protein